MVRVIALDLDGTLLNGKKQLTDVNRRALERAAALGVYIVPTTGRYYAAMPAVVRALPFVRYAITVNGAQVYDIQKNAVLYRAEIPFERGLEIMARLDELPVIYDCYLDGQGYMTRAQYESAEPFARGDPVLYQMILSMRKPVNDLKTFVAQTGRPLQKIQMFFQDTRLRDRALKALTAELQDMSVTSSSAGNIEINSLEANKGAALRALCEALSISIEDAAAFGDGLNDVSMLRVAGVGVAMGNAPDAIKAEANLIAPDCESDGVARVIDTLLPRVGA